MPSSNLKTMTKIYVTIEDDNGDVIHESESPTVDFAIEKLGQFERNQAKEKSDLEWEAEQAEREKMQIVEQSNQDLL